MICLVVFLSFQLSKKLKLLSIHNDQNEIPCRLILNPVALLPKQKMFITQQTTFTKCAPMYGQIPWDIITYKLDSNHHLTTADFL